MLKILALSYSELLLITTHCSWIVKKKIIYIFSPTLTSLFSFLSQFCLPMVLVRRWLSVVGCGLMVVSHSLMVRWSDGHDAIPGSRCNIPGSWVVVVKCFTTYQTKDPILTNNYPLIQAYNLLRFFRV